MMTLVTGGSGSGKSEYAERLAVAGGTPRIYVATMIPWDDEGRRRIEKHRAMRTGKGFETVECYTGLERLAVELARRLEKESRWREEEPHWREEGVRRLEKVPCRSGEFPEGQKKQEEHSEARAGSILLECVSNLTANEFYSPENAGREDLAGLLADEILALRSVCGHLVVVTNNVFNDGEDYDSETVRYMEILADVNRRLAAAADAAVEVIFGIPVKIK